MCKTITMFLGLLAVLWTAYTLFAVARAGSALMTNIETTSRVMSVRNGDDLYSAVALTYEGVPGAALVIAELAIVAGALAMSVFCSGRRRLFSLLVLVAWSALWMANALWLQRHGWDRPTDVIGIGAGTAVVLAWACLRLLGTKPRPVPISR